MKYSNQEKLEKIKLKNNNFVVVIDFDKTITAANSDDSWDASGYLMGEEFLRKSDELYKKFEPIEFNYQISLEEKKKGIEDWFYSCMALYYEYHLTQKKLSNSVEKSHLILREGVQEFLSTMHRNNVPVIIVSAGIGNVIEQFLEKQHCYYDNIHIISNFIPFDAKGNIEEYHGELIHSLNKTMQGHTTPEIEQKIKNRKYRLLLGDIVEDKKMVALEDWNNTISVGFLNQRVEENLEVYKKNFDIVLTEQDATFGTVREWLLKEENML